jgi:hypothetical protein
MAILQAGADINHHGNNGETVLKLAEEFERDKGFDMEILNLAIREMRDILITKS